MKIVLAPDSYKGSLSADKVCKAMERGIRCVLPNAEIVHLPMADGGEGTVDILVAATRGELKAVTVTGPLGQPLKASFGLAGDRKTAIIEMAAASGLPLVPLEMRNPLDTTTYGTGELIRNALNLGVKEIIIGIGGSATTDCGTGMAQALGIRFYDRHGLIKSPLTGRLMGTVKQIDTGTIDRRIQEIKITVACDVRNPLLGQEGAVAVYGPQKGAQLGDLPILESNMRHVIEIIESATGVFVRDLPGSGAAGGLGAGLVAFLNAELKPGIDLVLEVYGFQKRIQGADFIVTGEGRVDSQSGFGKVLKGVSNEAQKQGIPLLLVAGSVDMEEDALRNLGIAAFESLCSVDVPVEKAMKHTEELIVQKTKKLLEKLHLI